MSNRRTRTLESLAGTGALLQDGAQVATVTYRLLVKAEGSASIRSTSGNITITDGRQPDTGHTLTLRIDDGRQVDVLVVRRPLYGRDKITIVGTGPLA